MLYNLLKKLLIHLLKLTTITLVIFSFQQGYSQHSSQDIEQQIRDNNARANALIKEGKKSVAAELYNQSAYLLRTSEKLNEAAEYYQKVLDINTELGNRRGQMISHNSLAMVYLEAENYPKAAYHFTKELDFRTQINNKAEIIVVLSNLALTENEMSSFDSAIDNIGQAISLAKELNDLSLLRRCYSAAYDIYSKLGNNEQKAHEYFELYQTIDRRLKEQKMTEITNEADKKVTEAFTDKKITEQKLSLTNEQLEKTVTTLQQAEELTQEQQMELDLSLAKINEKNALLEKERWKRRFVTMGASVLLLFVFVLSFMVLKIIKANKEINLQRARLEKQNKEIKASIRYALTIQQAMLPADEEIESHFDPFILYRPKDIVSGDFYWISAQIIEKKQVVFFALVDCTGHGVPGAIMSMIGNRLLSEIVNERKITSPAKILETLNQLIRIALRQEQTDNNDGMDLALCRLDSVSENKYHLTFAGAKRPLYVIKNNENKLINLHGDRSSIGGYNLAKREIAFKNSEMDVEKGDLIYMFSDGITDQNNPERKKFGRIRLEEFLIDCAKLPTAEQKKVLEQRMEEFIANEEQRDDISLIGLKMI